MDDGFKRQDEVVAKDLERAELAPPLHEKGEELVAVTTTGTTSELPFSKARCVALVAVVASAPFLSVRDDLCVHGRL